MYFQLTRFHFFLTLIIIVVSCSSQKKLQKDDKELVTQIDKEMQDGAAQYKVMMKNVSGDQFPKTYEPKTDKFATSKSDWWCSGFYPGTLLYLYEQTKDAAINTEALR